MPTNNKHLRQTPLKSRAFRSIPKASKGNFVGEMVFNRGNQSQTLGLASLTEYNASLCLIYHQNFHDIEEQLPGLPFSLPNGKPSKHFFDFRVTQRGGRRVCISVKPERIAMTFTYQSIMAQVEKAAIGNICDEVKTITERNIDPVALHNAKLFHAARDVEPQLDALVGAALSALTAPVLIDDFLAEIGVFEFGFFAVARAIHAGRARLFTKEKIRGATLIERGAEV